MEKLKITFISKIKYYSQKGQGVAYIFNNIPVYIYHCIIDELIEFKIVKKHKNYFEGEIVRIIKSSKNRIDLMKKYKLSLNDIKDIGGYELLHMNEVEQTNFKTNRVIDDFKKIANINLSNISFFESPLKIYYRNKIKVFDGCFKKRNSNELIKINNYLLSNIKINNNLKGEIIYRQLNTLIYGTKKQKTLYTNINMFNLLFKVHLNSFFQINLDVAIEAYKNILLFINKNEVVLDLYCGIGTISLICSKKAAFVFGVEINKDAYLDALENKKINSINNASFFNDDVLKFLQNLSINKLNNNIKEIDTIILDPSREGTSKEIINLIVTKIKPKKIIYLSCNPATMARDFFYLKNFCDFEIIYKQIFDMFPQTYHIELLIVIKLKISN